MRKSAKHSSIPIGNETVSSMNNMSSLHQCQSDVDVSYQIRLYRLSGPAEKLEKKKIISNFFVTKA